MRTSKQIYLGLLAVIAGLVTQPATGMEDTKVLPKGVRNVILRSVSTEISSSTDAGGNQRPLGAQLEQGVTFSQLTATRSGLDRAQSEAFLQQNGFAADENIGQFTADLRGKVQVIAPVFSYGVTERWTLALAVPVYSAHTAVDVGFRTNARGQEFINLLASPQHNNTQKAREAATQMNLAMARMQAKLAANNYQPLEDWSATALGDITLLSKYRALSTPVASVAVSNGIILPTGRVDDPNILHDIGFGNGAYGLLTGVSVDEPLVGPFFLNQYAQYTAYLPATRSLRMKTADEALEVSTEAVRVDAGDKFDLGASLQADADNGLQGGVGYIWSKKLGDKIRAGDSRAALEANTVQTSQNAEAALGYSTIAAYQRGTAAVPFTALGTFRKQVRSTNSPVSDQLQFDVKVYF